MNKNAQKIGLKNSNFSNPTGLTDSNNYSTAYDICLLVSFCLKNHLMRNIFRKKSYICEAKN
jgi:D-alanyl-D-alanine carboxypeptidase (penicillin-binding protein 5/6)